MPNIFSSRPGRVIEVPGPTENPGEFVMPIHLEEWEGPRRFKCIVTSMGFHESVAAQFMNTLQNNVYVYIFGDLPTQIVVGGIAWAEMCPDQDVIGAFIGVDMLQRYYDVMRASSRAASVLLGMGVMTYFRGFLVDLEIKSADPSTSLCQFNMTFICPPMDPIN